MNERTDAADQHDAHGHSHPAAPAPAGPADAPDHDEHPEQDHTHADSHDHDHGHADRDDPDHDHAQADHDDRDHDHDHDHAGGIRGLFSELFHSHSHSASRTDRALESSARGIWALKVSLVGLLATAIFQVVIVLISGSAALLADTIHNFADALTALPLWIAFVVGRRPATRRYTYGFRRAEDLAGVFVVLVMLASAALAAWESYRKFVNPETITNIPWVMVAAVVGFLGNELVAIFRIRVGREIGSAALEADGLHARTDGLTSLAVLVGALGVLAGFPLADPIIGLLIIIPILQVVWGAAKTIWERLMDAVDPALVGAVEQGAAQIVGAGVVHDVRIRWLGHNLEAELHADVDGTLSTIDSHAIAHQIEHQLLHDLPQLETVTVHINPLSATAEDFHAAVAHHKPGRPAASS